MIWDDVLNALFGGDENPHSGGVGGASQLALGMATSQIPGPVGTIAGFYLASGVNFDDPSGIAGAQAAAAMEERAAALERLSTMFMTVAVDDDGAARQTTGKLLSNAGVVETASGSPTGEAAQTIGRIDESEGAARAPLGRGTTDDDADTQGRARELQRLDRGETSLEGRETESSTGAQKKLFAAPGKSDEFDYMQPRPENMPSSRGELVWSTDPVTPPESPRPQSAPATPKPEEMLEVFVRGTRPDRSTQSVPFLGWPFGSATTPPPVRGTGRIELGGARRVENNPSGDAPDRGFFDRGGAGLLLGGITAGLGVVIIISNPVGWVAGITGALMLAGGSASFLSSAVQLPSSYAGATTAEQDAALNRAGLAPLDISSPGGLLGAVAGTVLSGDTEGFESGAFVGGLAEGAASIGKGAGGMVQREIKFGRGPQNMSWKQRFPSDISAKQANQRVYRLGEVPARSRPNPHFPRGTEWIELSHSVPKRPTTRPRSIPGRLYRVLGKDLYEKLFNRPFNITPMWGTEHALIDPIRYGFMKQPFRDLHPQLSGVARWSRLTPSWLIESGYGAVRVVISYETFDFADDPDLDPDGYWLPH